MLGSTQIGAEQMTALADDLGPVDRLRYIDGILDYADRRMRAAVAELPDGVYHRRRDDGQRLLHRMRDLDPRDHHEIRRPLRVDYTGTDPQMKGFKNSSISNTRSATYVALTSFLDPEIPRNEGTYRCVDDRRAARHRRQSAPAGAR